jgi:hypothetical protein
MDRVVYGVKTQDGMYLNGKDERGEWTFTPWIWEASRMTNYEYVRRLADRLDARVVELPTSSMG